MTPEQAVALLPCPFCGEQPRAIRERSELFDLARIWCDNDECFGPRTTAANLEDATAQWNKRAPQPLVGVQRPEDVARIIDPVAWLMEPKAYGLATEEEMLNKTMVGASRRIALEKADRILALPHTGQPQEGAVAKWFKAHDDYHKASAAYNARLEVVRAERERGNWHADVEQEYSELHNAQRHALKADADLYAALSAAPASPRDRKDHCAACGEYMPPHARHMCANWPPASPRAKGEKP